MNNKIIMHIILALLLINTTYAEKYFVLDVNNVLGSVTFNSISLREIDRTIKYTDNLGFLIKTVSFENSDIKLIYYNMSESRNYIIYVPYSENAERIEIYNLKNSKVMDVDVSSFANTCGNKICEEYESYESCTKDCKSGSKDDFCDEVKDGICDPDCSAKTDVDCAEGKINEGNQSNISSTSQPSEQIKLNEQQKESPNYLIWILLIFAVIIFALMFFFLKKRKQNKIMNSLKQYIGENIRKGFTLQQIKDVLYREGYTQKEVEKAIVK